MIPPKLPIKVNGIEGKPCENIICGWKPYFYFYYDKNYCDKCYFYIYNKKLKEIKQYLEDIEQLTNPNISVIPLQ